jgi:hypothetical protein
MDLNLHRHGVLDDQNFYITLAVWSCGICKVKILSQSTGGMTVKMWGLVLVTGFIGFLQYIIITLALLLFLTLCSSLKHSLSLIGVLTFHYSSCTGFQRWAFPFLSS